MLILLSVKNSPSNAPKHNIQTVILSQSKRTFSIMFSGTVFSGTSAASSKLALAMQECKGVHQVVNRGTEPKLEIRSYRKERKPSKGRNTSANLTTYCLVILGTI